MAGYNYANLVTAIRNWTEVDSNVLTTAILNEIIEQAEYRLMRDCPIDADRKQQEGNLVTGQQYINCPAGCLFTRGIQVYTSTSAITGANVWLQKKDQTFLNEYVSANTATGSPKYYAQFGGATGTTDTTSGKYMFAPVPDSTYKFQVHFNAMPTSLVTNTSGTYISQNFGNGLLYACLVEAYGFLKGPMDMLTMYEQKYNTVVQKFAAEQIGRRRRDDYTDGTIRIPIESPNP
jgi:hypothetical protein|tara:strand:- start:2776 stop:3477 length:702 start_codon:yes stop_codon:yes gene_type:complete